MMLLALGVHFSAADSPAVGGHLRQQSGHSPAILEAAGASQPQQQQAPSAHLHLQAPACRQHAVLLELALTMWGCDRALDSTASISGALPPLPPSSASLPPSTLFLSESACPSALLPLLLAPLLLPSSPALLPPSPLLLRWRLWTGVH